VGFCHHNQEAKAKEGRVVGIYGHIKKEVEVEIPDDPAPTGAPTGSVLRRCPPEHCPFLVEKGGIRKKVASQTRMEKDKRKSAEGARIQSDKEDWR